MNKQEVVEMAVMKENISDLNKKVDKHMQDQREDFDKVLNKLDTLNGKFAGKWVETITIGLLGLILTVIAVIIANFGKGG